MELKPLTFGEILDGAFTMFRRHFGLFFRLSVVLLVGPVALLAYVGLSMFSDFLVTPMRVIGYVVPLVLLYYLASLVLTAATVRVISDAYLGQSPTFGGAIGLGMSKIWPLVVVGIAKGLIVGGLAVVVGLVAAAMAGLIGGSSSAGVAILIFALIAAGCWLVIWVACGYGVTTQVVVLEPLRPFDSSLSAFPRSWGLTRGARGRVFGLAVVAFLLFNIVPAWVLQFAGALLMTASPAAGIAALVLQLVLPVILAPAIACVFTLLYYDLRVRREAFDLQLLSQQLGVT